MTMMIAAVATGRPAVLMRLLATRPMRGLGDFSYSLYLVHLPIVMIVCRKMAPHFVSPGLPAFWFTLTLALPASVLAAARGCSPSCSSCRSSGTGHGSPCSRHGARCQDRTPRGETTALLGWVPCVCS